MIDPGPVLAIRADAGNRSGTGHVLRTLAVAREWLRRGGRVHYLTAEMTGALVQRLESQGCGVERIAGGDAAATAALADRVRASVLLVDHYGLDAAWWDALPAERRWKTAAVNDFAVPIHRQAETLFSPRVTALPDDPTSGPGFLLIREELRRNRIPDPPPEEARKLLLVLGGADPLNATPRVAKQLLEALPGARVRAVAGPAAANWGEIEALVREWPALEAVHCPDSMLPHYEWADMAVVSPSTTAFEALHRGLVAGLVVTAGNQEEAAAELESLGCARILADLRDPAARLAPEALHALAADGEARKKLSARGAALVDGLGAARVCDLLGLPDISFRPVEEEDSRLVWEWANDPGTRAASFSGGPIPWESHDRWFQERRQAGMPFWFAVDSGGRPLAVLRFDPGEEGPVISLNVAPEERGKGLAALIVHRACGRFLAGHPGTAVDAWIRTENTASQRCFEKAGFAAVGTLADRLLYRLSP